MNDEQRIAAAFRATLYGTVAVLALAGALSLIHGAPAQAQGSSAPPAAPAAAEAFGWPI